MKNYEELIKNVNILLADDDEDYIMMTNVFLKQIGYNVDIATDGEQALEKLQSNNYQIALLDYFMPGLNGEEVITKIRETNKEIIIILQTGFSGQKPPIETMKKLNIQNYHDKTEGIDRLNLEIISAVKIFNQQNEIQLAKYKTTAIGDMIFGIAQDIKESLLSISAGLEVTNMVMNESDTVIQREKIEKINKYYTKNKDSLEKIDRTLTAILNQSTENTDYILAGEDTVEIINAILSNESKKTGVRLDVKMSLKPNSYISGGINDSIFIICELIKELMNVEERGNCIELSIAEDEDNWYLKINSDKLSKIQQAKYYLISRLVLSVKNTSIIKEDNKVILSIQKKSNNNM